MSLLLVSVNAVKIMFRCKEHNTHVFYSLERNTLWKTKFIREYQEVNKTTKGDCVNHAIEKILVDAIRSLCK